MRPSETTARSFLSGFVRHRNAANLLMALFILLGVWGMMQLNRQLMPDTQIPSVNISLGWSGASAEDVEKNLLLPIEPAVRFLDGVTAMHSWAFEGRGRIQLEFEPGTDIDKAESDVSAAVAAVPNLPEAADAPQVSAPKFFDPVANIGIAGPFPEEVLRAYAREIRDGLLAEGLDQVTFTGYRDREILISVDDGKLRQLDITLSDLAAALTPNIADQPSGALPGEFAAQVRALAPQVTARDIAATELRASPTGEKLTFGDVATVEDTYSDNQRLGYMRGEPAIRLQVSRSLNADTVESYEKIVSYVSEVRPTLPAALKIVVFNAAAEQVNKRLGLLVTNGATGLAVVLLILFLFLDHRVAFWVAMGIPVSILATLGLMFLSGQTLNMMSMFALMMTLGIIVDDAIVVGEHTATRYAHGDARTDAAINGAGHMAAPVIAASLTTMAAFGPIFLVRGVVGQLAAAIPLVVLAVLTASLLECFFILPGHLAHSLPRQRRRPNLFRRSFDAGFAVFRERIFGALSRLSYRWRYATVALAVSLAGLSGALIASGQLGFQFFPTSEGESFNVFASFQPGIPQDQMEAIIVDIESAVSSVEAELSPDGTPVILTTYANLDVDNAGANFNVYLTPSETRAVRTGEITQALREALPAVAGVQSISVREFRGGPPGRAIDVQFSGADTAVLKQASEALQDVLEGFDGVTAVSDTLNYGNPELVMALNARGTALGFTLVDLGAQIRDAFEGRVVRRVAAQDEEITIRLKRQTDAIGSSALRDLWVRAPAGGFVPLSSIVAFSEHQGFDRIVREDGKDTVSVRADVDEAVGNADEILTRLRLDYLPQIVDRYGVGYDLGGRQAERAAAFADLEFGFVVALGVMYIIVAWIFASYAAPLAVMLIIPFGAAGAVWGHYLLGYDLTIISLMGLLGLSGIVVNDSIVLISRLQERLRDGEGLRKAATGAARDRLRAVLLTSLTTIGGLSPLLFEKSLEAQFLIPMAITIVFGLMMSTALVLFLVPAFIGIGADIGAVARWAFMTPGAPSFREMIAGAHHERPRPQPAE